MSEVAQGESAGGAFKVTVLAPDGVLWTGQAEKLIAPGVLGEFMVLPQHIPMVSLLRDGSVRVFESKAAGTPQTFVIAHGVCSVLPTGVVVLGDRR
jgi:F-type H+-transporting ATPase subunit epsilon